MVCHCFPIHLKTGFGTLSLVLFFALFFSFFLNTNNSFATTVDCGDIVSSFTDISANSSNHSYYYSLSSCDTSSLDSSLPWFYSINFAFSSDRTSTWSLGYVLSTSVYHSSTPDSLIANGGSGSNSSFSHGLNVSPSYSWGGSNPHFNNLLFRSFSQEFNISSLTLSISDSYSSTDCPVCEECEVCPAIPETPYDDKFDRIIVSIYTVGGILLFIYFLFTIYNMIFNRLRSK